MIEHVESAGQAPQDQYPSPIPTGGVIGILGGGQLGRMTAIAAARLGYKVHIFSPEPNAPAFEVSRFHTCASFDDTAALETFAAAVDVITCEMEHVPLKTLEVVSAFKPLRPNVDAFRICQNRVLEKSFLNDIDAKTADWVAIDSFEKLEKSYRGGFDNAILKIAFAGYDGKGQARFDPGLSEADLKKTWNDIFGKDNEKGSAILEAIVPFERELSVIVARDLNGGNAIYDTVENVHKNHILSRTYDPAPASAAIRQNARGIALKIAEALDIHGLLAVEMFLNPDGEILVNELAPRPHNSGHWTIDATYTDQFEQLVRAISGLPLGLPDRWADAEMINLIGDDVTNVSHHLEAPTTRLHLYGKESIRPGRKMGHATIVKPLTD